MASGSVSTAFVEIAPKIAKGFQSDVMDAAGPALDKLGKAFEGVGGVAGGAFDGIKGAAGAAFDGIQTLAGAAFDVVGAAAKTAAVGAGAVVTALGVVGKGAFDAYASYEQLTGGVQTLFNQTELGLDEYAASVGKTTDEAFAEWGQLTRGGTEVMKNANKAWATAGLSANDYMETVTSFSASLITSLGGDTVKAAEIADLAIVDMSDNANKFGSSMDSIQVAYAGFAKQNYTMLDNLKLGYGGTKSEMERLLKDAGKLANTEFNIDSYADVIEAIHVIQESFGVAGATAAEASTTIEGSINSLKAAWANTLTAIGTGDLDMIWDAFDALGEAATNAFTNVWERVQVIADGIGMAIPEAMYALADRLPPEWSETFTNLGDGFWNLKDAVDGFLGGLTEDKTDKPNKLAEALGKVTAKFAEFDFVAAFEDIGGAVEVAIGFFKQYAPVDLFANAFKSLGSNLEGFSFTQLLTDITEAAGGFIDAVKDSSLPNALAEAIEAMGSHLGEFDWKSAFDTLSGAVGGFLNAIGDSGLPQQLGDAIGTIGEHLGAVDWSGLFEGINTGVGNFLSAIADTEAVSSLGDAIGGIIDAVADFDFEGAFTTAGDAVGTFISKIEENGTLDNIGGILENIGTALTDVDWELMATTMADTLEPITGIANAVSGAVASIADMWSNFLLFNEAVKEWNGGEELDIANLFDLGRLAAGLMTGEIQQTYYELKAKQDEAASSTSEMETSFSDAGTGISSTMADVKTAIEEGTDTSAAQDNFPPLYDVASQTEQDIMTAYEPLSDGLVTATDTTSAQDNFVQLEGTATDSKDAIVDSYAGIGDEIANNIDLSAAEAKFAAFQASASSALATANSVSGSMHGFSVSPHAEGGIFTTPHVGLVAEAGVPEMVLPKEGSLMDQFADAVTSKVGRYGGGGQVINIYGDVSNLSKLRTQLRMESLYGGLAVSRG